MGEKVDFEQVIMDIEAASSCLRSAVIELGKQEGLTVSIKNMKEVIGDLECSSLIIKKRLSN